MAMINLPYGNTKFDSDDLVKHIQHSVRNYIIQGQVQCNRRDHPKPNSLDCWLRDNYARNPDTKQAVNEVIDALVATGDFKPGKFKCPDCPDSGKLCKGIELVGIRSK
jgi:hypothetical protein